MPVGVTAHHAGVACRPGGDVHRGGDVLAHRPDVRLASPARGRIDRARGGVGRVTRLTLGPRRRDLRDAHGETVGDGVDRARHPDPDRPRRHVGVDRREERFGHAARRRRARVAVGAADDGHVELGAVVVGVYLHAQQLPTARDVGRDLVEADQGVGPAASRGGLAGIGAALALDELPGRHLPGVRAVHHRRLRQRERITARLSGRRARHEVQLPVAQVAVRGIERVARAVEQPAQVEGVARTRRELVGHVELEVHVVGPHTEQVDGRGPAAQRRAPDRRVHRLAQLERDGRGVEVGHVCAGLARGARAHERRERVAGDREVEPPIDQVGLRRQRVSGAVGERAQVDGVRGVELERPTDVDAQNLIGGGPLRVDVDARPARAERERGHAVVHRLVERDEDELADRRVHIELPLGGLAACGLRRVGVGPRREVELPVSEVGDAVEAVAADVTEVTQLDVVVAVVLEVLHRKRDGAAIVGPRALAHGAGAAEHVDAADGAVHLLVEGEAHGVDARGEPARAFGRLARGRRGADVVERREGERERLLEPVAARVGELGRDRHGHFAGRPRRGRRDRDRVARLVPLTIGGVERALARHVDAPGAPIHRLGEANDQRLLPADAEVAGGRRRAQDPRGHRIGDDRVDPRAPGVVFGRRGGIAARHRDQREQPRDAHRPDGAKPS